MTKQRSPLWYELPLLFSIIGGIIAYVIIKKDDPIKAKRCIVIGIVLTIPLILILGWIVIFGLGDTFVIASGSMIPTLLVYDVVAVDRDYLFEDIVKGDIIVFHKPSGNERTIVARVFKTLDDNPLTLQTKGDANPSPIPSTDFPITKSEYIGKMDYVLPQIGYITQILKPPTNYVINIVQFGLLIIPIILHVRFAKETNKTPNSNNEENNS